VRAALTHQAAGGDRQRLVEAAAVLAGLDQLGKQAAQRPVDLEGGQAELLSGGDRNGQGVHRELERVAGGEGDLHGLESITGG
jgi:hypothetical protein